jgi:DNA helicase-2/ATP-dependent DNA helicase PcrA
MGEAIEQQAERAARLLLQHYKAAHPAWCDDRAPVDALASWAGLDIAEFPPESYAPGTYGFMDPDEEEHLIWLCSNLPDTLRRFTLAHELGHAVLHCRGSERIAALQQELGIVPASREVRRSRERAPLPSREDPCYSSDIEDSFNIAQEQEFLQETLGGGHAYDPRSQYEIAANAFAAELLMPLECLRTLYLSQQLPPQQLASYFAVSQSALLNRLVGLLIPASLPDTPPSGGTDVSRPQNSLTPPAQKQYDEFQQAAIEAPTPALITAGPGSGKTSTLIGRVAYLVSELGVPPARILALTFSRKAAQEMEERLQQVLEGTVQPRVSTFHAFCADVLRQYGDLVGLRATFTLVDEAEGYFTLRQLSPDMLLRHYQNLHMPTLYFSDMLKAISRAKDELVSPAEYAQLAQLMLAKAQDEESRIRAERALELAHVYALYEAALQRRGDTDFGGLLVLTVRLLREQPEVLAELQQQYQHILVDEFQDMNRASGVLLRELAGEARRVWVVGDANQAIYGFRGASPANIGQFTADFPGATVLPLSRNYRSRPDLVKLAESFRCRQLELGQEPGKNLPARPAPLTEPETSVTVAIASDETSEFAGIVQDMRAKHARGYAYRDMVVLCRTRTTAQKMTRALVEAGLPVVERGGMLEQEHIKNALAIVLLHAEKSGMGLLRTARLRSHPLSTSDLEAFLLSARKKEVSPLDLLLQHEFPPSLSENGRASLLYLSELLEFKPAAMWPLLAQYLLIETSLVRDLLGEQKSQENQAMLEQYAALLQLARHYDQQYQARLAAQPAKAEEADATANAATQLAQCARGFLEYLSLLVSLRQDGGERTAASGDAGEEVADVIRVMTVHASKGLEFPIVYLPGLVQRRFPSSVHANPVPPPEGMLPPESEGNLAHESGEACLFYVGVTRAREHVIVSRSERYGKQSYKPSPYLDALLAGLPPERITELRWDESSTAVTGKLAEVRANTPHTPSAAFIKEMKPPLMRVQAIEAYLRCPRQYAYSTIYAFAGEEQTYRLFWQATQETVEEMRKRVQDARTTMAGEGNGRIPTQEQVLELYAQRWQALGGPDAPFASMYEQHGREVVESVRNDLARTWAQDWQLRPDYSVEVAGKTVYLTVDRVERSLSAAHTSASAPVRFVRTRFGKRKEKPTAEVRDLLYTLAYRQMHPGQKVELHSHNLSTGEVVPIALTARKEQSLYEEVVQGVLGLERDDYPATPADSARCPSCPFFFICPA